MAEDPRRQVSPTGSLPLHVSVFLDGRRIEGRVHLEDRDRRFSDLWESALHDQRAFLAMTDATVRSPDGEERLEFVLVDRADVRMITPVEEPEVKQGPSRKVTLSPTPVTLVLEGLRVQGTVYVEPDKPRFSDAWEALLRDRRPFIILTDARVVTNEGCELSRPAFLAVEKDDVLAVFPSGEEGTAGASARRLQRTPVRAMLVLDGVRIEGTIHLEPGIARFSRFSDRWDALIRERRSFIAVTDASLWEHSDDQATFSAPFVAVDKADIRAVYPLE